MPRKRFQQFGSRPPPSPASDDGATDDAPVFSQTGTGIGVGPTQTRTGRRAVPSTSVSTRARPAAMRASSSPAHRASPDVSAASALTFQPTLQAATLPPTPEFNLHEDVYDGATEDECQALVELSGGSGFTEVPLSAFAGAEALCADPPWVCQAASWPRELRSGVRRSASKGPETDPPAWDPRRTSPGCHGSGMVLGAAPTMNT